MAVTEQNASIHDLSGSRTGPRSRWYSLRSGFVIGALFGFGALALYLFRENHHPIAAPTAAFCFLVYGVLDQYIGHQLYGSPIRWKRVFWVIWNLVGLLAPLFVFLWLVRGTDATGPTLLWPLLVYPFYFLLRILHPPQFIPWMVFPILALPIIGYAIASHLAPRSEPIDNAVSAIWLFVTLAVISVHLRTWDYHKNRFDAYRALVKWAGSSDARLEDVETQLRALGAQLKLDRLTVLEVFRPGPGANFRNLEDENLFTPAKADINAIRPPLYVNIIATYLRVQNAKPIRPWPLTHGLLGLSYRERKSVACPDSKLPPWDKIFYNPLDGSGYENTRCEFVVPIWDSPKGEIIGFVDLQSEQSNGLQPEDIDYLNALSAAIAPLITKARHEKLLLGIEQIRLSLEKTSDEASIFNVVVNFARDYLDADVVTYYKLGFGSGWPLLPPLQLGAWYPDRLQDKVFLRKDAPPISLVSKWVPVYESDPKSNSQLLPPDWKSLDGQDYFILREEIQSMVFLPIGIPSRRVGALFLNFRRPKNFNPSFRLELEILRRVITPHMEYARQINEAYKGFGQTAFVLHDLLRESLGASLFFEPYLNQLKKAHHARNNIEFDAVHDELKNTLGVHTKTIKTAYLKSTLNHHKKLEEGLASAFRLAAGWLEEQYSGRSFRWEFTPPSINTTLTYDLRMAINSIVVETVHNAIRHGRANLVKVKVRREDGEIIITMFSDGIPWDPAKPSAPFSEFGISARLTLAHDRMKAEHQWGKEGCELIVRIPILPTLDERDPYENETSANRGR